MCTRSEEDAGSACGGRGGERRATMNGVGQGVTREQGGGNLALRRHPSRIVSDQDGKEDAGKERRAMRFGAVDRAVDIGVAARALLAGLELFPGCLHVWVYCVCASTSPTHLPPMHLRVRQHVLFSPSRLIPFPSLSALRARLSTAAQKHLIIPPQSRDSFGQLPALHELQGIFDSASVFAPCGTRLPLNDHEKKKHFMGAEEKGGLCRGVSVSFDLASGLALDWWCGLLAKYQEHISELWAANEPHWNGGANLSSPGASPFFFT
jgi:hypothetical protein